MKSKTTIEELTKADLENLFSTALSGIKYLSVEYEGMSEDEDMCEGIIASILLNGGSIRITHWGADACHYGNLFYQYNEDFDVIYRVRYVDVVEGLERAASGTFNLRKDVGEDFAKRCAEFARRSFNAYAYDESEWDYTTAECLMQIILFNEIVYG